MVAARFSSSSLRAVQSRPSVLCISDRSTAALGGGQGELPEVLGAAAHHAGLEVEKSSSNSNSSSSSSSSSSSTTTTTTTTTTTSRGRLCTRSEKNSRPHPQGLERSGKKDSGKGRAWEKLRSALIASRVVIFMSSSRSNLEDVSMSNRSLPVFFQAARLCSSLFATTQQKSL